MDDCQWYVSNLKRMLAIWDLPCLGVTEVHSFSRGCLLGTKSFKQEDLRSGGIFLSLLPFCPLIVIKTTFHVCLQLDITNQNFNLTLNSLIRLKILFCYSINFCTGVVRSNIKNWANVIIVLQVLVGCFLCSEISCLKNVFNIMNELSLP